MPVGLPTIPNTGGKYRREITAWGGLNRTEDTREGELRDAVGLTTEQYPVMSPCQGKGRMYQVDDFFMWDGQMLYVQDGMLCYTDNPYMELHEVWDIGPVLPGKKQFALINSKIVIWPDKVALDLTNMTLSPLDASVYIQSDVEITDSSIKATIRNMQTLSVWEAYYSEYSGITKTVYTYGQNRAAVMECFTSGTGWDIGALQTLGETLAGICKPVGGAELAPGDIIILDDNKRAVVGQLPSSPDTDPDTDQYSSSGYIGIVTAVQTFKEEIYIPEGHIVFRYSTVISANVYAPDTQNVLFSDTFKVGDGVNITGTPLGIADVEHVTITAIDDTTNTLSFPEGSIIVPTYYAAVSSTIAENQTRYLKAGSVWFGFTTKEQIPSDVTHDYILFVTTPLDANTTVYVWDNINKRIAARYDGTYEEDEPAGTIIVAAEYDLEDADTITVRRPVPDMDFICESQNRLWGVSNSVENKVWNSRTEQFDTFTSRVIYASSLGEPGQFWRFTGLSTDSWQAAVGSEGDFTAITSFGGAVCAFKERMIYKIMGDYPAEYYTSENHVNGVTAGSDRSLAVINGTLFYNGVDGVYAYSGGIPSGISAVLGKPIRDAVGGGKGTRYYISGMWNGNSAILVYDLQRGLWMKAEDRRAERFVLDGNTLWMLYPGTETASGYLYLLDQGDDPYSTWSAELVPFTETDTVRKYYIRLELRLDMKAASTVKVEVKYDNGDWETAGNITAERPLWKNFALPIRRCDRFYVRISGTGVVKIRDLTRVFRVGSER